MIESRGCAAGPAGLTSPGGGVVTGDPRADEVLARLRAVVGEVGELDLAGLVRLDGPSAGLLAAGAEVETARRMLGVFDTAYVAALETADEPARNGCPSTATFLRLQLRLSPGEAKRRVQVAHACTVREEFGAGVLPPPCPVLAAAQGEGVVCAEHAAVIIDALDKLPAGTPVQDRDAVEARLVTEAAALSPGDLARLARRILDHLDPDGTLRDEAWQQKVRGAALFRNNDGTGTLRAHLTTQALEVLQTVLTPLAAPVPTGPDGPDPRTAPHRLHDALLDAGTRLLNGGDLPASGGTATTMVIHLTEDQLTTRTGLAVTDNGNLIPVGTALAMAIEATIYTLVTTSRRAPLWLGRTARTATPAQTIALAARDRGCAFPGCDRPPALCQRHHINEWVAHHGPTDITNLVLLCGFHHREFKKRGWTVYTSGGIPYWIPPHWIDPNQKPLRNTMHQPLLT